jgi:hypothetical protein
VRADVVPELDLWKSTMIRAGHRWGEYLNPTTGHSLDDRLATQYYDAQWVFYQIADYTGNTQPWLIYASYAMRVYRDEYLIPNGFRVQGFRRFPEGLYEHYRRGGSTTVEQLRLLRDMPAFSTVGELSRGPDKRSGYSEVLSREVAYAVAANIIAEKAELPRVVELDGTPRLGVLISMIENHLWEWRNQEFADPSTGRVAPFMLGLTGYTLIEWYEWELANQRDPNALWPRKHWTTVDAALIDVFSWLHEEARVIRTDELGGSRMWVPLERIGYATFRYMDRTIDGSGGPTPAPDLNQLIAPVYYWLYQHTGNEKYLHIGDQLFSAGVRYGSADSSGKHFNQLYRLSFRSRDWRGEGRRRHGIKSATPKYKLPVKPGS